MDTSKASIVSGIFAAYMARDREAVARAFTDDFTFTSPYDNRIGKAEYFERCWPAGERVIKENRLERIVEQGGEVFVTYLCTTTDGKQFRNTEFFRFDGDKVRSIDVYFGATYKDGAFVKQAS